MSRSSSLEKKETGRETGQARSKSKGWFSRKKAVPDAELGEKETGEEAKTTSNVEVEPLVPPVSFIQLFRYSTKFELFIDAIGIFAATTAGATQPVMSLLFGRLTQAFVEFGSLVVKAEDGDAEAAAGIPEAAALFRKQAAANASYLVYVGIAMFACTYTYMFIWIYTGEINAKRIREKYLQAILRQEIAFFDKVGAGEVTTRIQTDTHLVQQGMSQKVALVANILGSFVAGFAIAYARNWRLALAMSVMLPCIAITGTIMNKWVSFYMQRSLKHIADGGSFAEEVVSSIRTAQAFGTQRSLSKLYGVSVVRSLDAGMKASAWQGACLGALFFVVYGVYGLAFHFGTTLINQGHATAGEIVNVVMAVVIGSFALGRLAPQMAAVIQGCGAAAKLYQTIDRVPVIDSAREDGLRPENVAGEISLEHVNFSYPSRPDVQIFKDLTVTFKAGKTAALVGASGSGKSTIISMVERFYDPLSGVVKLDGVDVRDLNLKWLRSQIGLVSQEPTLFATTIKGNVAHGLINTPHEKVSEEEQFALIKEACIKANADGFISKLPNGYDTMVGERGFLLSGGQKQRIAIARAIVSDPRILLLDEATSALDTQSEGVVQDALDKASTGRTTITVAHRLSTIKDADVIYVMGEGSILEAGSHTELLENDGAYAKLVQAQKLRDAQDQYLKDTPGEDDGEGTSMNRLAHGDASLKRRSTGMSVSSDFLKQQEKDNEAQHEVNDHSFTYVFKRMGWIIRDQWPKYLLGVIFAVLAGMVYPAFGLVFASGVQGFSYDEASERRHAGDRNGLWFLIIAIVSTFTTAGTTYLFAATASHLTARLRTMSFNAILRQDIAFFDRDENSTGALIAKLSDNPQKVNGLAGITLSAIFQAFTTLLSGAILGLAISWKISLVGIACVPLVFSAGYIHLRVVVMKDQTNRKAHAESSQLACEATGAIRTVAALTREDDCLRLYSKSLELPLQISNRTAAWSQALYALSQCVVLFVIALTFWYGSRLVSNFEVSNFQFFVGLMSVTFSTMEVGSVFGFVPDMSSAKGAGSEIIKLLDLTPEIDAESEGGKKVDPAKVQGHIRFENVHFRYPTRQGVRVLRDFSFEVLPGTYVALVGASGSGKSTTIQLIERFYDPLAGDIYLDGENISDLNIQEYRKQIALVSQEPTLYAGTIRFNILLGAIKSESEVTQEEIEAACRDANILQFIQSLPQGFDTEVGGKGSQLSGGQKQRIAIARALLRNPKVLLLDEATSALDSTSEKVVQAALDQASRGRTTIAIAHRLSTIQNADCIYFVKDGRVSEYGTHNQLIAKQGDYHGYVQLQALPEGA